MRLPRFTYLQPKSLAEALTFLSNHEDALVKAGGADLIPRLKWKLATPKALINLNGLSDLNFIRRNNRGDLHIGALTPLRDIESSPVVRQHFAALVDAVTHIASIEIRNIGTLGGNICLDTRCQFYNQPPLFRAAMDSCFKTGGSKCYISRKENRCHALFCADTVPLLIGVHAELKIISPNGERLIGIQGFYTGNGKSPFALLRNELVAEIRIPELAQEARAVYLKYRLREAVDFPIAGIAVLGSKKRRQGQSREMRIVVGGATSRPSRCFKAEAVLGTDRMSGKVLEEAGETAAEEIQIVSRSGCSLAHRRTIVKQLLIRGVQMVLG
jgi:4-hydroxybenzoyl-CoA reductase subunit beta